MRRKEITCLLFMALFLSLFLLGTGHATLLPGGVYGDDQTSIFYSALTGELAVDAPLTANLTSIDINSDSGIFTGAPAQNLGGSFDFDSDTEIFKATFGDSFGSLSFGFVAVNGLSESFVLNDLTVIGSLEVGSGLGLVDLIYEGRSNGEPVPEPATMLLLGTGLVGFAGTRIRKRTKSS